MVRLSIGPPAPDPKEDHRICRALEILYPKEIPPRMQLGATGRNPVLHVHAEYESRRPTTAEGELLECNRPVRVSPLPSNASKLRALPTWVFQVRCPWSTLGALLSLQLYSGYFGSDP